MTRPFPEIVIRCMFINNLIMNRLSSLGVKVLDSEEVERNVLQQAQTLSEKESVEYKECIDLILF